MRKYSSYQIDSWQNERLKELINHAYQNTIYYRNVFNGLGMQPDDISTIEDLSALPILTKNDIISNYNDIIPKNIYKISYKHSSTGGSSGDPLKYLLDLRSWSYSNANTIQNWERTDYNYGDRYVALGSTSLFVDKNPSIKHRLYYGLKNKIGLNGINMSRDVCERYIKLIKKQNIKYIYGYASAIYMLAQWVIDNGEYISIKACFTTSEVLSNRYRNTIAAAFQCKIVDCYGAHDGGITAYAHDEGNFEVGYNCLVRVENMNNQLSGSALLTDLLNYAMPLINYKLGDEITIGDTLRKTYNGTIIKQVLGRSTDIIQFRNGNALTAPGFSILFKDLPVDYYCIEKACNQMIICHIIKQPGYNSNHEYIIISSISKQAGDDIKVTLNYTDEVRYTKSGKRQYFVDNTLVSI